MAHSVETIFYKDNYRFLLIYGVIKSHFIIIVLQLISFTKQSLCDRLTLGISVKIFNQKQNHTFAAVSENVILSMSNDYRICRLTATVAQID